MKPDAGWVPGNGFVGTRCYEAGLVLDHNWGSGVHLAKVPFWAIDLVIGLEVPKPEVTRRLKLGPDDPDNRRVLALVALRFGDASRPGTL